uniref:Dynein axonemal intermediate chain 7 n=1 Tax=Amphiprion percula TaxID=161767 RepID=A0A3P8STM4_AMPPE
MERERKEKEVESTELIKHSDNNLRCSLCVQWERYMRCDGAPDPTVQQDINTYISLWRDDPEVNITAVLKQCNLALQVCILKDVTDPQENQKYQEALINLQELIHSKHRLTTEDILKRASSNTDTETGNMQTVIRDEKVTVCLWANIKKNPRFKGLNFEEVGFGFEIPKQLAVSDVAVRILHTHYDHLSMLARMTHLRIQTASHRFNSLVETKENREVEEDSDPQSQRVEEEVQSIQGLEGRKVRIKVPGKVSYNLCDVFILIVYLTESEGDLICPSVQLPLMNQAVHVVDLMQFTPLGGVFFYDVFHLPPQALHVNGWEIRQFLDTGLQMFHYPTEKFDLGSSDALIFPPIGASVMLPDYVVFLETPQVAHWDAAEKQWRMDGITDVSYDEAQAKISFKMDSFQAFVLMQKTYANLPFRSWELRPLGQDAAIFTVSGALIDLSITIQDNQCLLQSEQDQCLSCIMGKWMSISALQKAMINAGVNIFVNEYTDKYVSTCGKVCEHLDSAPVPEDSWSLYLLGAQRSQKLEITEESEDFSPDHHPSSEFHSTFIHMLQDSMSPGGVARTRESHHLFVDTVQSLLCATRPLMYS